jgi:hypothetical protein
VLGLVLLVLGSLTKLRRRTHSLNNIISVIIYFITILNVVISIFNDESLTMKYRDCLKDLKKAVPELNQSALMNLFFRNSSEAYV